MSQQYRLAISGLSCANCASKVEKALAEMKGVAEVSVVFSTSSVYLTLENGFDDLNIYKDKVKSLGYHLSEDQKELQTSFSLWSLDYTKTTVISGIFMLIAIILAFINKQWMVYPLVPAIIAACFYPVQHMVKNFRNKDYFGMNTLVTLAVFGAVMLGEYFEGALVVFLYNLGQVVEFYASSRAKKGISKLLTLAPEISYKITEEGVQTIASSDIEIGDRLELRAGSRLAVDAIARSEGEVDESAITGESLPRYKNIGDHIAAGSIALGNPIEVEAQSTAESSSLMRIAQLVEDANSRKSPIARQVELFTSRYTPIVVGIAVILGAIIPLILWIAGQPFDIIWIYRGLTVLMLGCPCALVLAPPTAVASALSAAAKEGVLLKSGGTLEGLAKIQNIAFDKTGTLTKGKLSVVSVKAMDGYSKEDVLHYAVNIEQSNNHPIAVAIRQYANIAAFKTVDNIKQVAGKGIFGTLDGADIAVLSTRAAQELDASLTVDDLGSHAVVLKDQKVIGYITLQDELREDSVRAIKALRDMNVHVTMLTGDNKIVAEDIAQKLDIEYRAELLPAEKLEAIQQLKEKERTVMVGDGINDAPALMAADIGIAMGSGSDIALDSADVALASDNMGKLPFIIELSKSTRRYISGNIAFALGFKIFVLLSVFLLPLSFVTSAGLMLAVLADTGSTVFVTLNSMRLLRFKDKHSIA